MLLGIDTCGSSGTIALARSEGTQLIVLGEADLAGKTYSALLVPRMRALLEEHKVPLQQLEAIVVVNGPGSFTGVRVGLSAVKGLAEALQMPVVAVSRLAVLAWKARQPYAVLDAGRGEFYFGDYATGAHEALLSPQEIRSAVDTSKLVVCEEKSALAFHEALVTEPPRAAEALDLAMPRLQMRDFNDIATLDGNYLRRSDAELFARPKPQEKVETLAGKTQDA